MTASPNVVRLHLKVAFAARGQAAAGYRQVVFQDLRIVARDHEVLLTRYEPRRNAKSGSTRVVLTPARL